MIPHSQARRVLGRELIRRAANNLSVRSIVAPTTLLFAAILLGLGVHQKSAILQALNVWADSTLSLLHGKCDMAVVLLTMLGDPAPIALICLLSSLIFYTKGWGREAKVLVVSSVICIALVYLFKYVFSIERPNGKSLVDLPGSPSYPSAHAACSLAVLGLIGIILSAKLQLFGFSKASSILIASLFFILALAIGISRIYVGVHWATDVIGGFIIATAVIVSSAKFLGYSPKN